MNESKLLYGRRIAPKAPSSFKKALKTGKKISARNEKQMELW